MNRKKIVTVLLTLCAAKQASLAAAPDSQPVSNVNAFDSTPQELNAQVRKGNEGSVPERPKASNPTQMPHLRRLGGLLVESNLEEFRVRHSALVKEFYGFPATTVMGDQIAFRLGSLAEQASVANGRFWYLPPHAADLQVASVRPGESAGSLAAERKKRKTLQREFDLDGWVTFKVNFYPDHTEIVATLFGLDTELPAAEWPSEAASLPHLATESLILPSMPSEEILYNGFARVWARLSSTSGHLSAVTWHAADLVRIDVGHPLVTVGEKLVAGEVHVQRRHPRTGEVLQTVQVPKAELEVIETHEQSALARVTALARSLLASAQDQSQTPDLVKLLVWKEKDYNKYTNIAGADQQSSEQYTVQQGNTGIGFKLQDASASEAEGRAAAANRSPALQVPRLEHLYVPQAELAAQSSTGQAPGPIQPAPADLSGQEEALDDSVSGNPESAGQSNLDPAQNFPQALEQQSYFDALTQPETWVHHSSVLAVGQSWAVLDTEPCPNQPCDRYSGFPVSIVNSVAGTFGFVVSPGAALEFSGELAFYSGGDVEGVDLNAKALSVHPFSNFSGSQFSLFFGPELSLGNVKTVLFKEKLNHFALLGGGGHALLLPSVGKFMTSVSVSLFDALQGDFNFDVALSSVSLVSLPRELGIFLEYRRSESRFIQANFGISWNFPVSHASSHFAEPH